MTNVRPEALELFSHSLNPADKVLITGAAGWFGQTALAMTKAAGLPHMATGSKPGILELDGEYEALQSHNFGIISDFQPTVVIDTAFLTREKVAVIGAEKYIEANKALIDCSLKVASLASVRKYVGFSSGAAVHLAGYRSFELSINPYAALKRSFEEKMLEASQFATANISIPRVWSVTGAYLNKAELFAFSNLILQAKSGTLQIRAEHPILRRYCPAEDVIAIAISQTTQDRPVIFDTGGELLEIGHLADLVRETVDPLLTVTRSLDPNLPVDDYYSNGEHWSSLSIKHGLHEETALEQLKRLVKDIH